MFAKLLAKLSIAAVAVLLISNVLVASQDDESCRELFKPENMGRGCCETFNLHIADIKECNKSVDRHMVDRDQAVCEVVKCSFAKHGLLDGDEINEKRAVELLQQLEKKNPNTVTLTKRVRDECLTGQYKVFPAENVCLPVKFHMCFYINTVLECPEWKKNDICTKIAEHAKKCKSR